MTDEQKLYQCECGSTEFELFQHGQVRCARCEDFFSDMRVEFPDGIPEVVDALQTVD